MNILLIIIFVLPMIIWFGYRAYLADKNIYIWAIFVGGILTMVLYLIISIIFMFIFKESSNMTDLGAIIMLFIVPTIITLSIMITLGVKLLPKDYSSLSEISNLLTTEINKNWSIIANTNFEILEEDDCDLVLERKENKITCLITNENGKSKELFDKYKSLYQKDNNDFLLKEYEFNIEDKNLYGYYYTGKIENDKKLYHILQTYVFVDNEFGNFVFYCNKEEELEWALTTWKYRILYKS